MNTIQPRAARLRPLVSYDPAPVVDLRTRTVLVEPQAGRFAQSARPLASTRYWWAQRITLPHWALAALLVGALVTASVGTWAMTSVGDYSVSTVAASPLHLPAAGSNAEADVMPAAPVVIVQEDVTARDEASRAIRQSTEMREQLGALQSEMTQLVEDMERSQRDNAVIRSDAQEQTTALTTTQNELAQSEARHQAQLQDIQGRIASLTEQLRSTEQFADEIRATLKLPATNRGSSPAGGPAAPDAQSMADPWESLKYEIVSVESRVQALQQELSELETAAQKHLKELEEQERQRQASQLLTTVPQSIDYTIGTPTGMPVVGPLTSSFGSRISPFLSGDVTEMHTGIDIAVPEGTPVKATAAGVVRVAGPYGGYGNIVIVDHGSGLSTWYGHNAKTVVEPGKTIGQGEVIALSGNTGNSTGPHVHYEVRINEVPVDPMLYMNAPKP